MAESVVTDISHAPAAAAHVPSRQRKNVKLWPAVKDKFDYVRQWPDVLRLAARHGDAADSEAAVYDAAIDLLHVYKALVTQLRTDLEKSQQEVKELRLKKRGLLSSQTSAKKRQKHSFAAPLSVAAKQAKRSVRRTRGALQVLVKGIQPHELSGFMCVPSRPSVRSRGGRLDRVLAEEARSRW